MKSLDPGFSKMSLSYLMEIKLKFVLWPVNGRRHAKGACRNPVEHCRKWGFTGEVHWIVWDMCTKYCVCNEFKKMCFSCFHSLLLLEQCYIAIDLIKKKSNIPSWCLYLFYKWNPEEWYKISGLAKIWEYCLKLSFKIF